MKLTPYGCVELFPYKNHEQHLFTVVVMCMHIESGHLSSYTKGNNFGCNCSR